MDQNLKRILFFNVTREQVYLHYENKFTNKINISNIWSAPMYGCFKCHKLKGDILDMAGNCACNKPPSTTTHNKLFLIRNFCKLSLT